jgi:hypothetical protein
MPDRTLDQCRDRWDLKPAEAHEVDTSVTLNVGKQLRQRLSAIKLGLAKPYSCGRSSYLESASA